MKQVNLSSVQLSWPKSRCKGAWLHRYEFLYQYPETVVEVCTICGTKIYFKIVDGRIDNLEYIRHHMRQVLLPQHSLFQHEYKK